MLINLEAELSKNITLSDESAVERQTNGHSSDSSNLLGVHEQSVVCVKKMMKNRRSYSAATCAAVIGAGHPLRNRGVCWYATKQPS